MAARSLDEQAIFEAARKTRPGEAREAYLQQVCGDDAALGQRVRALLKAYEESASFLESPAAPLVATLDEPLRERPGTVIGPYKLLEQIGEGGFGVVFMAEQHAAGPPQGRPEGHQAGHGHAGRWSPASRPSGRRWP